MNARSSCPLPAVWTRGGGPPGRRTLPRSAPPRPAGSPAPATRSTPSPDWGETLIPHGWAWVRETEAGSHQWCRPGKSGGVSATTGFAGSDLLYAFSSNADPFEPQGWYTKFHAFTLLNHEGDFRAAARDLARRGYGACRTRPDPLSRYAAYVPRSLKSAT